MTAILFVFAYLFGSPYDEMRGFSDSIAQADPHSAEILDLSINPYDSNSVEVEVQARADDFVEAFRELKKKYPDANIFAVIDGRSVDHISHMEVTGNGTLLLVTFLRRDHKYSEVYKVEDVEQIGHRQRERTRSPVKYPAGW